MTPPLVTLAEARAHLRIDDVDSDGGPDDVWLNRAIRGVSAAVGNWLKDSWRLYEWEVDSEGEVVFDSQGEPTLVLDSAGDPILRDEVVDACLVELESRNVNRGGEGDADVPAEHGHGYILGKGATGILVALRRPTVA